MLNMFHFFDIVFKSQIWFISTLQNAIVPQKTRWYSYVFQNYLKNTAYQEMNICSWTTYSVSTLAICVGMTAVGTGEQVL